MVLTGQTKQPHPLRPRATAKRRTDTPERRIKLADARRRSRERRAQFEAEQKDG